MITRLLVFLVLFASIPAHAEETFGMSMVGSPKYGKYDTHLSYANPAAPKGGDLKQAAIGSFDTLNPYSIKGRPALGLPLVTDRLMARVWDEPFSLYPLIAERAVMPENRSSITFYINPNAKFHDGSPITVDDVIYSFETMREGGRPNQRRIYKLGTPEKVGENGVKFSFKSGYDRETGMIFALMPVISKKYWEGKTFDQTTLEPPLGSGPYKIAEFEPGKKIIYERVKDYWAKNSLTNRGHHNFDRIIYEYFRDDTVAFESFKKGDLNIRREWDAGDWNSNYDFKGVTTGDVKKEELKHGRPDKVRAFIFNTRRAPFDDIRVRQALNLLFDFDWINKNFFHGKYQQIDSFFPNTYLAYRSAREEPLTVRQKMKEANRLLMAANWTVDSGIRVHKDTKEKMSFEILLDDPRNEKIALALTNNIRKAGIEVNVRVLDSAAFRGRLNDYDYDMIMYHWNSTLSPGTEQHLYWSCEAAKQPSRWNFAGICDPEIDALTKSIPKATSRGELAERTQKLDKMLLDGQYMIPLYHNPQDFIAYWKPLKRPQIVPLYGMVIETWWTDGAYGE